MTGRTENVADAPAKPCHFREVVAHLDVVAVANFDGSERVIWTKVERGQGYEETTTTSAGAR